MYKKKSSVKLWSFILAPLLLLLSSLWIYLNQGRVFFDYKDMGEGHVWTGRARLEIGILDGLRVKKATIGPIEDPSLSTLAGLQKESIMVDYYDFDNNGQDDVLVSAKYSTDFEVMYFLKIGRENLDKIYIVGGGYPFTGDNSLYGQKLLFGPKDERGRYTFIDEHILEYANAPHQIWRTYYGFNDKGEIVFNKLEKEDIIATVKERI